MVWHCLRSAVDDFARRSCVPQTAGSVTPVWEGATGGLSASASRITLPHWRASRQWHPVVLLLLCASSAFAAAPKPPSNVRAADRPNDQGHGVIVTWAISPDDTGDPKTTGVLRYDVLRRSGEGDFEAVGMAPYSVGKYEDAQCVPGETYLYQVAAVSPTGESAAAVGASEVTPRMEYINTDKLGYAVLLMFVSGAVVLNIALARRQKLWLRPIPALQAVDEAVGRATEMGRPCVFVTGVVDIDEMPTIAGLTVLSRVARTVAEYDADLIVPTSRSLVMTAARETVQGAYLAAGRPEQFRPDSVHYVTDEQFGFASAVVGTIVRERAAACFYFGQFYAESLVLAETGQTVGAIQIAGTNETSQLPFFVAACDYTLIGEEFFAASAYLSGEPQQLGSIKGQDMGKLLGAGLIVLGVLLASVSEFGPRAQRAVEPVLTFLTQGLLG